MGPQHLVDFPFDSLLTFLRRAGPAIPFAFLAIAMRSKRISKKVKLLSASIFDTGLRLVKREPQALHHAPRPLQCLFRVSATENHEVVGVGDDARFPELSL